MTAATSAEQALRPRRPKQPQRKIIRRAVDGVLLLDKPIGMSSNGALQAARRLLNAAKAGHTGTLDPMASGLLPLTFGEATKFSQMLLDADKVYEAEVQLGVETDSGDAEGAELTENASYTVFAEPADQEAAQPAIQAFLAALWDIGLQPGHAARSVRQCAEAKRHRGQPERLPAPA